jgi:hypothetical protein
MPATANACAKYLATIGRLLRRAVVQLRGSRQVLALASDHYYDAGARVINSHTGEDVGRMFKLRLIAVRTDKLAKLPVAIDSYDSQAISGGFDGTKSGEKNATTAQRQSTSTLDSTASSTKRMASLFALNSADGYWTRGSCAEILLAATALGRPRPSTGEYVISVLTPPLADDSVAALRSAPSVLLRAATSAEYKQDRAHSPVPLSKQGAWRTHSKQATAHGESAADDDDDSVARESAAETVGPGGRAAVRLLRVWCDMTTDGGGYTIVPVRGGLPTSSYTQHNTCEAMGLQLAIPRTKNHLAVMLKGDYDKVIHPQNTAHSSSSSRAGVRYMRRVLPGVLADRSFTLNLPLTFVPMTSNDPQAAKMWHALDHGEWFQRGSPFTMHKGRTTGTTGATGANGGPSRWVYDRGCWLQVAAWRSSNSTGSALQVEFGNGDCNVAATDYLCSTNDKGGSGISVRNYGGKVLDATGNAVPGRYELHYTIEPKPKQKSSKDLGSPCKGKDAIVTSPVREVVVGPGH